MTIPSGQADLPCSATAVVVMGVAGCGKSTLAKDLAARMGWSFVEGDDFHTEANRKRMQAGIPLTDERRQGWLNSLGRELQGATAGVVLSCSALQRTHRDALRAARPGLRFVYLELSPTEAQARVIGRGSAHFFNPILVDSQFRSLQPPIGEVDALTLDAKLPVMQLCELSTAWLLGDSNAPSLRSAG